MRLVPSRWQPGHEGSPHDFKADRPTVRAAGRRRQSASLRNSLARLRRFVHALTAEDWTWLDLHGQRLEAAAALLRGLACIAGEAKEGKDCCKPSAALDGLRSHARAPCPACSCSHMTAGTGCRQSGCPRTSGSRGSSCQCAIACKAHVRAKRSCWCPGAKSAL